MYFMMCFLVFAPLALPSCGPSPTAAEHSPPNILFAISDDQSYPHAGAYGCQWISTPAFDGIAREGVLFSNAFVASPGCSPSRAAILTGRHCWELEEAGNHASSFPARFTVFTDLLEEHGYMVGYTGKGWGPGNWKISGRERNPAGDAWSGISYDKEGEDPRPAAHIRNTDYAANFRDFLEHREQGRPFFFWYGASEPHRTYEKGAGIRLGMDPDAVVVPGFLPDVPEIRSDLLDYAVEVQWFDHHLATMIAMLKERGELDNTIIIATGDNGMPFPSAKANCFEFGIHVPLAISWPGRVRGDRTLEDLVSMTDLAPTLLDAAGIQVPDSVNYSGKSLMNLLVSDKEGTVDPERAAVYASRERHSSSRWNNLGYPIRAMRTRDYLYIRNFKPERWPAGAPQLINQDGSPGKMHFAYTDIDGSPSKETLIDRMDDPDIIPYFQRAVAKRPAEELYDIHADPACMNNLADDDAYRKILENHKNALMQHLRETSDPRATGNDPDVFESHIRYSPIRTFPEPDWVK